MPLRRGEESATDHGGGMPAYSSDPNPIEGAFSEVKQRMRRTAARTHDGRVDACRVALDAVTAADADDWIRHSGYRLAVR